MVDLNFIVVFLIVCPSILSTCPNCQSCSAWWTNSLTAPVLLHTTSFLTQLICVIPHIILKHISHYIQSPLCCSQISSFSPISWSFLLTSIPSYLHLKHTFISSYTFPTLLIPNFTSPFVPKYFEMLYLLKQFSIQSYIHSPIIYHLGTLYYFTLTHIILLTSLLLHNVPNSTNCLNLNQPPIPHHLKQPLIHISLSSTLATQNL